MDDERLEQLKRAFEGPITEEERQFLNDMTSFIEFAVRNGLSFSAVMGIVGHDVNGILRSGGLAESRKDGFLPKVTGYSKAEEDSVGETHEQ